MTSKRVPMGLAVAAVALVVVGALALKAKDSPTADSTAAASPTTHSTATPDTGSLPVPPDEPEDVVPMVAASLALHADTATVAKHDGDATYTLTLDGFDDSGEYRDKSGQTIASFDSNDFSDASSDNGKPASVAVNGTDPNGNLVSDDVVVQSATVDDAADELVLQYAIDEPPADRDIPLGTPGSSLRDVTLTAAAAATDNVTCHATLNFLPAYRGIAPAESVSFVNDRGEAGTVVINDVTAGEQIVELRHNGRGDRAHADCNSVWTFRSFEDASSRSGSLLDATLTTEFEAQGTKIYRGCTPLIIRDNFPRPCSSVSSGVVVAPDGSTIDVAVRFNVK